MRIDHAIDDVRDAEADLATRLRVVGERHAVEHDLYHLGHARAEQCVDHLQRLRPFAERYGARPIDPDTDAATSPGFIETLRHKTSEVLGRSDASGLLLLADLRENYLAAQRTEINWIMLLQAAKAARDGELVQTVTSCHEQTEVTAKWLRTKLKVASPQVLAAG